MSLVIRYNKLKDKTEQIVKLVKSSNFFLKKDETPLYFVYPCDNYINTILSNDFVRKTLQLFVDKYCKDQIQNIRATGQLVNKDKYPYFYDTLQNCCNSLSIKKMPDVYVTNRLKGINALSVGTDQQPIILISQKAMIGLPNGELKFMIGHELGHILQKNLMCHTIKGLLDNLNSKSEILGPIVSDLIDVPLNQWYRCAEYTADRAGFICAGSISFVKNLFFKLSNGIIRDSNNIEKYFELSNIHPMYDSRIKQLEQFVMLQKNK